MTNTGDQPNCGKGCQRRMARHGAARYKLEEEHGELDEDVMMAYNWLHSSARRRSVLGSPENFLFGRKGLENPWMTTTWTHSPLTSYSYAAATRIRIRHENGRVVGLGTQDGGYTGMGIEDFTPETEFGFSIASQTFSVLDLM